MKKKFFALYLAPVAEIQKMMANTTPEQMKEGMSRWNEWMKNHRDVLVDMGAPLGKTKRVMMDGISDVKNEVTGYSIVEAESHEEAAKLFEGNPHFELPGAYIDVLEIMPMPEM